MFRAFCGFLWPLHFIKIVTHPGDFGARRGSRSSANFQSGCVLIKTGADESAGVREKLFRLAPDAGEAELEVEERVLLFRKVLPQRRPRGQRTVDSNERNLGRAVSIAHGFARFGIDLVLRPRFYGAVELHLRQ